MQQDNYKRRAEKRTKAKEDESTEKKKKKSREKEREKERKGKKMTRAVEMERQTWTIGLQQEGKIHLKGSPTNPTPY